MHKCSDNFWILQSMLTDSYNRRKGILFSSPLSDFRPKDDVFAKQYEQISDELLVIIIYICTQNTSKLTPNLVNLVNTKPTWAKILQQR